MMGRRLFWILIVAGGIMVVLQNDSRDDWLFTLGLVAIAGVSLLAFEVAKRRGYEWRKTRFGGFIILGAMAVIFLTISFVSSSITAAGLGAMIAAVLTTAAIGLRRPSGIQP